jgi:hypothetical protein
VGVPDVSFCVGGVSGWIELKVIDRLPKHVITPVRVPHFTPAQRAWLKRRGIAGGNTWLLLKVIEPKTYLLFLYDRCDAVGRVSFLELQRASAQWWCDRINWKDFFDHISRANKLY